MLFAFLSQAAQVSASGSTTYYVRPDGDDSLDGRSRENAKQKISSAISAAGPGDTIRVAGLTDWIYIESVTVGKEGLTIISESGPELTIVQTPDPSNPVFTVTANSAKIIGFTIENATGPSAAGILLQGVKNCRIEGNILSNNTYGIRLNASENNNLSNNTCTGNSYGMSLYNSQNNTLLNNTSQSNVWAGISLESSPSNTLAGNSCGNNLTGIYVRESSNNTLRNNSTQGNLNGIHLKSSTNNFLTGNSCSGNSYGIYLEESSNNALTGNYCGSNTWSGIFLESSSNNILTDNPCSGNKDGISLHSSSNNTVLNNVCSGNEWDGIRLGESSNNTVQNNTCGSNSNGIHLEYSLNNVIENNICQGNSSGISLGHSSGNTIENNSCQSNGEHGIYLGYSSGNDLLNNTCGGNSDGIHLGYSTTNTLSSNTCESNSYGIYALYSSGNTISRNQLLNNQESNAYDNGANSWDYNGRGNFWDDWQPPEHLDANGDGVVDAPRSIAGGTNRDGYPLTFPYFWFSVEPESVSVHQGGEGTVEVTVTGCNYDLTVNLTASGQPSGVSITFNPSSGTPTFSSTMTISVEPGVTIQAYTITIRGRGADGKENAVVLDLEVTPPPDFTIGVSPGSSSVAQGESAAVVITVAPVGGFAELVNLSVSGLPSGATATFSPSSGTPDFTSTLTISTSPTTLAGTYTITVDGAGGGRSHSTTCGLTVTPARDFIIEASLSSLSVVQGDSAAVTIAVSSVGGFAEQVTLSALDLPEGAVASFEPTSGTPSFTSAMTVSTSPTTPAGTYTITIEGAGGGKTHTLTLSLTLTAAPPSFPLVPVIGAVAGISIALVLLLLYRRRRAAWTSA